MISAEVEAFVDGENEKLKNSITQHHNKWSTDKVVSLTTAYKQFIELKTTHRDWDCQLLCPPHEVRTVWELHVLDTETYATSCRKHFNNIIHYDLIGELNCTRRRERQSRTRRAFLSRFGADTLGIWDFKKKPAKAAAGEETMVARGCPTAQVQVTFDDGSTTTTNNVKLCSKVGELKKKLATSRGVVADELVVKLQTSLGVHHFDDSKTLSHCLNAMNHLDHGRLFKR